MAMRKDFMERIMGYPRMNTSLPVIKERRNNIIY